MDRLTLPKRPVLAESGMPAELSAGIPPGTLPRCAALPLDAKLPMVPGPKGSVVLFTTNMGEKIHVSSQELDFDLTDPNSLLMSNGYKPLHDPHLKMHLKEPQMRRRLRKGSFITRDGKVLCTLKEFNEWRQYLRKIYLALERRKEQEQREREGEGGRPRRGSTAASLAKQKEDRVREVKERIKQQLEEDKQRYQQLLKEEEARVQRRRQEQQAKQTEHKLKYQALQERRMSLVTRRQAEERSRKITAMRRWMEADERRVQLLDSRRKDRLREHQRRLDDTWEARKQVQQGHLDAEIERREREELMTRSRIEERERLAMIQKQAHQAAFQKIKNQRRRERERREHEYSQNFSMRLEKRLTQNRRKHRGHQKASKSHGRRKWTSNWDIESAILASFSDEDTRPTQSCTELQSIVSDSGRDEASPDDDQLDSELDRLSDESSGQGFGDFHGAMFTDVFFKLDAASSIMNSFTEVNRDIERAASQLGMSDMQGAIFNPSIFDLADSDLEKGDFEERNLPDDLGPKMAALKDLAEQQAELGELPTRPGGPDMEDIAACMVAVSAYIASQVLLPAMVRYQEELEQDQQRPHSPTPRTPVIEKRSVRFNLVEETIEFEQPSEMIIPDWSTEDQVVEAEVEVEGEPDDDSFGVMVQGRDSLTKMRRLSLMQETLEPYSLSQDLDANVMEQIHEDYLEEHIEAVREPTPVLYLEETPDDRLEEEMVESQQSSTSSFETPSVTTLSSMLKKILDDFSNGKLTSQQVRKLVKVATEIIEGASGFVFVPSSPRDSQSTRSTGSSTMADLIVQHTLNKVQGDLFRKYGPELNQPITMAHHHASVNTLASIIVNKALTLAAGAIMKLANEVGVETDDAMKEDESRRASVPKLPQISPKSSDHALRSRATPERSSSYISDVSALSGTSSYIQDVLERVADELKTSPVDAATIPFVPVTAKSTTNDFIEGMLRRIVAKMQPVENATSSVQSLAATSTSSGALTDVVLGTLEHVVKELQLQAREPSETSQYIASVLNRAAEEIREQSVPEPEIRRTISGSSTDSQASAMSDYIRSTLATACQEVEEEYQSNRAAKSATSLFAEELVCDTLNQCLHRVRNGTISQDELSNLAAAILEAHVSCSNRDELAPFEETLLRSAGGSSTISSRTSGLMDQLIADTLAKIQESIVSGKMSGSDIGNLASKINKMKDGSSEESSPRSDNSSNEADAIVQNTIFKVLNDIKEEMEPQAPLKIDHKPPESEESKEAVLCVEETLQSIVSDLTHGNKSISVKEPDQEKSQSEDELGEVGFQPTVNGTPVDIDKQVLNETLLSISARHPETAEPNEASGRNSFLNLVNPEVTNIPVIDPSSQESVKNSLLCLSSKTLQLKNSALVSQIPPAVRLKSPEDSIPRLRSRVLSEMIPRSVRDVFVPEENEEESDESVDSDEGRVVAIYDNECSQDMPSARSQVGAKQKSSTTSAKVPPLPALESPGKRRSTGSMKATSSSTLSQKATSSSSKISSRGSTSSVNKTKETSVKSRSSIQRLVSPKPSKVSAVYGSPSPTTSKSKSSPSRKSSQEKLKTTISCSRKPSEEKGVTTSNTIVHPQPSQETNSPRCSNPLFHPRKASMDNISMSNVEVTGSDSILETDVMYLALGGKPSDLDKNDNKTDAITSSSPDVSKPSSKKSSDRSGKSVYGRTVEMTSSGSYQRLKSKESLTKKDSARSKTRSSHKTMDMTPRPSSAFGKTNEKILSKRSSLGKSRESVSSLTRSKDKIDGTDSKTQLPSQDGSQDATTSLSKENTSTT